MQKIDRTGETSTTTEGYLITIVEYKDANNIVIEFENTHQRRTNYTDFTKGLVSNPFHKTKFSIGFIGGGKYNSKTIGYSSWDNMFSRCYSILLDENYPTYKGCSVVKEWHNFQVFAKWFEENFKPEFMSKWHLDKDLLVRGNKIYGPETCCFLPQELNKLLTKPIINKSIFGTGIQKVKNRFTVEISINDKVLYLGSFRTLEEASEVYKTAKEKNIKQLALKFKDLISDKVYQVLINYKL